MATADHTRLVNDCRKELNRLGILNWNNQTSGAWAGKVVYQKDGEVLLRNARFFYAGLCDGSSDIIGATQITITQEMVGKKIAVFSAFEEKTGKGKLAKNQELFAKAMNHHNCIFGEIRDAVEITNVINNYVKKLSKL
jgi:hypothetical protein